MAFSPSYGTETFKPFFRQKGHSGPLKGVMLRLITHIELNPDRSLEDKDRFLVELEHIENGDPDIDWICMNKRKSRFRFLNFEEFCNEYRAMIPDEAWFHWLMESGFSTQVVEPQSRGDTTPPSIWHTFK